MPDDIDDILEPSPYVWTGERIDAEKKILFHEEHFSTTDQRLERAIRILQLVKHDLSQKRSSQTIRMNLAISELQEILGIITDPECEGPLFKK